MLILRHCGQAPQLTITRECQRPTASQLPVPLFQSIDRNITVWILIILLSPSATVNIAFCTVPTCLRCFKTWIRISLFRSNKTFPSSQSRISRNAVSLKVSKCLETRANSLRVLRIPRHPLPNDRKTPHQHQIEDYSDHLLHVWTVDQLGLHATHWLPNTVLVQAMNRPSKGM